MKHGNPGGIEIEEDANIQEQHQEKRNWGFYDDWTPTLKLGTGKFIHILSVYYRVLVATDMTSCSLSGISMPFSFGLYLFRVFFLLSTFLKTISQFLISLFQPSLL